MTRRSWAAVALVVLALGAAGCDQKPQGPAPGSCAGADTHDVLRSIVLDNLAAAMPHAEDAKAARDALAGGDARLTVEAVRTVAADEKLSRSSCGAQLRLSAAPGAFEVLAENATMAAIVTESGWKRDGDGAAVRSIDYVVQPTDDRKQLHVQLEGAQPIVRGAGILAAAAWVERVKRTGSTAPATAATASATAGTEASADGLCAGIDASTTVGALDCEGKHFQVADAELNANYKAAMARLTPDRQAALRAEQRAWLAGRDSGCEAEVQQQGLEGTSATLAAAGCVTKRTKVRAEELAGLR